MTIQNIVIVKHFVQENDIIIYVWTHVHVIVSVGVHVGGCVFGCAKSVFILPSFKLSNKTLYQQKNKNIKRIWWPSLISIKGIFYFKFSVFLPQLPPLLRRPLGHPASCMGSHTCLVSGCLAAVGAHSSISTTYPPPPPPPLTVRKVSARQVVRDMELWGKLTSHT